MITRRQILKALGLAGLAGASVATIKVEEMGPNDILALKIPGSITAEQAAMIRAELQKAFTSIPKHKMLILTEGIDIKVLKNAYVEIPKKHGMSFFTFGKDGHNG